MSGIPMTPRVADALVFMAQQHGTQTRSYTNDPYVVHPIGVMMILYGIGADEDTLITALLHDTREDCGTLYGEIESRFGTDVADMVELLSDLEVGNRATRKELTRNRLAAACSRVQTIKVADLFHNLISIRENDPKFFKVFCREAAALLSVLTKANRELVHLLWDEIPEQYRLDVDWSKALSSPK